MFKLWRPRLVPPPRPVDPIDPETYFKGINRPTSTLCTLLAAEMLRNLDAKKTKKDLNKAGYYDYDRQIVYEFPSFFYRIREYRGVNLYESDNQIESFETKYGLGVTYDKVEKDYMSAVFKKFLELRNKSEVEKKEAQNQQRAIDAIAKLVNASQPVDNSLVAPDIDRSLLDKK